MHILFLILIVPAIFIGVIWAWWQCIPLFRWLMFIWLLVPALAVAIGPFDRSNNQAAEIITVPLAIAFAWFVAALPIYYQRWQEREVERWREVEAQRQAQRDAAFDPTVVVRGMEGWARDHQISSRPY